MCSVLSHAYWLFEYLRNSACSSLLPILIGIFGFIQLQKFCVSSRPKDFFLKNLLPVCSLLLYFINYEF